MIKWTIRIFLILVAITVFTLFYLSFYGIDTDFFYSTIQNIVKSINPNFNLEFQKTNILLDLKKLELKVKVTKPSKLFNKNKIFKVGRYHSLKLFEPYNSNSIKISMRCDKTNIPMGIEDLKNKVFGFQFHPESFLTENGNFIIKKILSA